MELTFYSSVIIVFCFSVFVVLLDEFIAKPWRRKRWEQRAASGDPEAQELLRMAKSAKVTEE
jgi:hypothetical protein